MFLKQILAAVIVFQSGICTGQNIIHAPSQNSLHEKELEEHAWKIGGKIHFEEKDGANYLGLITLNKKTRDVLKEVFQVDNENENCANNAKVLLDKDKDGKFSIHHYEEKKNPGVGQEMHATLLYTSKQVQNGHETLRDVYQNLQEIDKSLPHDHAPSVEQVAKTYQAIVSPDWEFTVSDVVLIRGDKGNVILAKLLINGNDEIINEKGQPVSGGFLHISLANVQPSVLSNKEDEDKINKAVQMLDKILSGKSVKVACKNGQADLEFGISGSSPKERIRP